jgi:SAM-dependent methyltransferase
MMAAWRAWAAGAVELFDDPAADGRTVVASLRDIARINRAFGGSAAAVSRLDAFFAREPAGAARTLLDVGVGAGDIPRAAATRARRRGLAVRLVGAERHPAAAREARRAGGLAALLADGAALPFATRSVDYVLCAKLLHHFTSEPARALLRELDRVARRAVVVADIRRSPVAAAGIWLASFPMGFHPVTRRDAVISVLRGFTADELADLCTQAGVPATVRRHPGWTLTAAWTPDGARP